MPDINVSLLWLVVAAVALLILMIAWLRLNAFLALLFAAFVVGLGGGMDPLKMMKTFEAGMGTTLGGIAGVLGLGTMLGGLLAASGGAEVLAQRLVKIFGPKRLPLCLMCLALSVGLLTWFAVGLVMLLPILLTLAKETKVPFLKLALPLLACLSVMHGVMPPHPGPLVAIEGLGAQLGLVLVWGALVAVPVAAISGPIFAKFAVCFVDVAAPAGAMERLSVPAERPRPALGRVVASLGLPVVLLLLQTAAELTHKPEAGQSAPLFYTVAGVIGHPVMALGLGVLFAAWALGFTRTEALKVGEQSLAPITMTLLLVGAGGGFNRVLKECGAADAIGALAQAGNFSPMIFGWLCAAMVRVATGSATVSIIAATGLIANMDLAATGTNPELLVVAIGCGSLFLSHLNDSGFWLVKESLGLTVGQTLRTWTVVETLVGVSGLMVCWLLDQVF